MNLQSMTLIFAIIVIPMALVLFAYIGFQIDTQSLLQRYDTILLDATHDAVVAFQLNSLNDDYSTNPDELRRDIKASINALFTSLATNLDTPGASSIQIMQYVPAVVVTLYDGYYIYSPIEVEYTASNGEKKTKYEHALKPYIHYSARYKDGTSDLVINYSLDNYITVYGYIGGEYISKSGYLIAGNVADNGTSYNGISITDSDAIKYYKSAKEFTNWIMNTSFGGKKIVDVVLPKNAVKSNGEAYTEFANDNTKILNIANDNNPEEETSYFYGHKREIMKQSIQSNLNNAIYVYDQHTTLSNNFSMPVLTEQDWDKILNNVNIITFMQGIPVGTKTYNNYSIITSTKNKQFVSKDLLYFIADGEYHKINCPTLKQTSGTITGYKSIDFEKKKDENNSTAYKYEHSELACYNCIVQSSNEELELTDKLKQALYNALGRERWKLNKIN